MYTRSLSVFLFCVLSCWLSLVGSNRSKRVESDRLVGCFLCVFFLSFSSFRLHVAFSLSACLCLSARLACRLNVLLFFIPLSFWSVMYGWSPLFIFIANFLALIPLASLLGSATEELALHTGGAWGPPCLPVHAEEREEKTPERPAVRGTKNEIERQRERERGIGSLSLPFFLSGFFSLFSQIPRCLDSEGFCASRKSSRQICKILCIPVNRGADGCSWTCVCIGLYLWLSYRRGS